MFEALHADMRAHAAREYPRECCGLVVGAHGAVLASPAYVPCRNRAQGTAHFVLHEEDYVSAADAGDVLAVVHSHPDVSANPSMADRVMCSRGGVPWLIVGWPSGVIVTVEPDVYTAPLIGREFAHGTLDCYSLVRDYFASIGIEIPDFERHDGWWERGEDLYLRNFGAAGFVEVGDGPVQHDVVLMQVLADQVNHAAVYLGDSVMLHHLYGRLSCRDVYGGYWQRHTRKIVRHRSLQDAA